VKVRLFTTGPFQENCYLVVDDSTGAAAIVDPGADGPQLVAVIRDASVSLEAIWITHAHVDHIGAVADIKRAWEVPVFLHPADLPLFRAGAQQAAFYGLPFDQPPDPDASFEDGMHLRLGQTTLAVMHAPGHSPGHVVLHGHGTALVGDCLFAGSIGRTDLPLADGRELERTLSRLMTLPPDTRVLPGHGPETTIGEEMRSNPFLTGVARPLRR
jgi:glyoxylase-like metal-dependent hydrolase (beta-lactamase superfamily II)